MHDAIRRLLSYFEYEHLPSGLRPISAEFHALAHALVEPDGYALEGPEIAAGLRKLLEAKDCAVRAALDPR